VTQKTHGKKSEGKVYQENNKNPIQSFPFMLA